MYNKSRPLSRMTSHSQLLFQSQIQATDLFCLSLCRRPKITHLKLMFWADRQISSQTGECIDEMRLDQDLHCRIYVQTLLASKAPRWRILLGRCYKDKAHLQMQIQIEVQTVLTFRNVLICGFGFGAHQTLKREMKRDCSRDSRRQSDVTRALPFCAVAETLQNRISLSYAKLQNTQHFEIFSW